MQSYLSLTQHNTFVLSTPRMYPYYIKKYIFFFCVFLEISELAVGLRSNIKMIIFCFVLLTVPAAKFQRVPPSRHGSGTGPESEVW